MVELIRHCSKKDWLSMQEKREENGNLEASPQKNCPMSNPIFLQRRTINPPTQLHRLLETKNKGERSTNRDKNCLRFCFFSGAFLEFSGSFSGALASSLFM